MSVSLSLCVSFLLIVRCSSSRVSVEWILNDIRRDIGGDKLYERMTEPSAGHDYCRKLCDSGMVQSCNRDWVYCMEHRRKPAFCVGIMLWYKARLPGWRSPKPYWFCKTNTDCRNRYGGHLYRLRCTSDWIQKNPDATKIKFKNPPFDLNKWPSLQAVAPIS